MKKKYAMIIDLKKCVGCGGCDLACKTENNTPDDINWASHTNKTTGTFPNVQYLHIPTLCNHCEKPACVRVCPTGAMHKDVNGTVMHDASACIGCKSCMLADPYGVIHFNKTDPHSKWNDKKELIPGCTSSPNEIHTKTKSEFPHYNPDRSKTYAGVRYKGIVEKCTFCDHRTKFGQKPFCVDSCPADARIFGDLNDVKSEISILLKNNKYSSLKPEKGTNPKVYYIGL